MFFIYSIVISLYVIIDQTMIHVQQVHGLSWFYVWKICGYI